MSLIRELVRAIKLRDFDAGNAAIESYRGTRHSQDIDDGESDARTIKSRASPMPPLSDEMAAAVWSEIEKTPSHFASRKHGR